MMVNRISAILVFVLIGLIASCRAEQVSTVFTARSCFVIEAEDNEQKEKAFEYGRQLIPYFEEFSADQHLSGPASTSTKAAGYMFSDHTSGVVVSLHFGMGERRASANLFADHEQHCTICQAFEEFMRNEVGKDFKVINCGEVEGFRTPKLYSKDLRKE